MPIKESSDELNPPVAIPAGEISHVKRKRTAGDYVALAIATVGVGYFPIAPGTVGSMVGVGLYLAIWGWLYGVLQANAARGKLNLLYLFTPQLAVMLLVIVMVTLAGIWAATLVEKASQKKDPSIVVIDEVAGQ